MISLGGPINFTIINDGLLTEVGPIYKVDISSVFIRLVPTFMERVHDGQYILPPGHRFPSVSLTTT